MTIAVEQAVTVTVRLFDGCTGEVCAAMADRLFAQLGTGAYTWPMAVLPLDRPGDVYEAGLRTGRKRAAKARWYGYHMGPFERSDFQASVNEINRSKSVRQGRPMADAYMRDQQFTPEGPPVCDRHRISQYGVFDREGFLRAYTVVHRSGELALVSQLLGHGDHEPDGIIQLLGVEVYRAEQPHGGFLVYNRWDGGQEGLQLAKHWLRYRPMRVLWA